MDSKLRLSLRSLKSYLLKCKYYSVYLIFKIIFWDQLGYWISDKFNEKKYVTIEKYLYEKYKSLIESPATYVGTGQKTSNKIWVFWWQGKEKMPELCRVCYLSLLKHCGGKEVVLLSQSNLENYLMIPKNIKQKLDDGYLSITNFSDIVRCMLLAKYGGLWVDSTLYFTQDIPRIWFDYPFFSIKNKPDGYKFVSRNRWSTFIMGTNKDNGYFNELAALMIKYTEKEKVYLEYMTIDYFMDILFKKTTYSSEIEKLPVQNEGLHSLRMLLNKVFDRNTYDKLASSNVCFKLSYKLKLEDSYNGKPTFYKLLRDENL